MFLLFSFLFFSSPSLSLAFPPSALLSRTHWGWCWGENCLPYATDRHRSNGARIIAIRIFKKYLNYKSPERETRRKRKKKRFLCLSLSIFISISNFILPSLLRTSSSFPAKLLMLCGTVEGKKESQEDSSYLFKGSRSIKR